MKIETSSVRVSIDGHDGSAYMNVDSIVSGCVGKVAFPSGGNMGHFWLARWRDNKSQLFLIGAPSEKWRKDIEDEGYVIVQDLSDIE